MVGQLAVDEDFERVIVEKAFMTASADDFCLHWPVAGLAPATSYSFRFVTAAGASDSGRFTTAPASSATTSFRFVLSGDSDGARDADGNPGYNEFEALAAARGDEPSFFLYIGDTIYADSSLDEVATALPGYRAKYLENRGYGNLRELLASAPVFAMIDDHEVINDFSGQTVDPGLYAAGYRAFREYFPIGGVPSDWMSLSGPGDAAPLYRSFRWGAAAEFFILDTRSYRSASAVLVCGVDSGPTAVDFIPDLGRPAGDSELMALRRSLGYSELASPSCLESLDDPARTILGDEQKTWLKEGLAASDAAFKFVVSGVPIQQFFADPYDRWEGFTAERRELLTFISERNIAGVIFLSTDVHANLINDVSLDHLEGSPALAVEVVTGPIATRTLARGIADTLGEEGVDLFANFLRGVAGTRFVELDVYSYALFEVDAAASAVHVSIKDDRGQTLYAETIAAT